MFARKTKLNEYKQKTNHYIDDFDAYWLYIK